MTAPAAGLSPTNAASPVGPAALRLDALLHRTRGQEGRVLRQQAPASDARSGVMSSTIQMPRPWVASTRSLSRGWTARSRTATVGNVAALELRPVRAAVDRDPEAELGAEEEQLRVDRRPP